MTSVTICTRGILAVFHSDLLFIERSCGTFWILIASRIWRFIGSLRHLSTTVMLNFWISSPWTLTQCFYNPFSVACSYPAYVFCSRKNTCLICRRRLSVSQLADSFLNEPRYIFVWYVKTRPRGSIYAYVSDTFTGRYAYESLCI